jgi:uncharacterized protein with HEPN domain
MAYPPASAPSNGTRLGLTASIGEAARRLPPELQALAPDIPWPQIIGMRNVLVHGYFDIDTEIVWQAVTRDLPRLKPQAQHLLDGMED